MTVGEVRRRLLGPEAFNFSLLGALLRRAKMPEKSKALVNELRAIGLIIPRGRRRAEKVTLMSALTEQEADQLAGRHLSHLISPITLQTLNLQDRSLAHLYIFQVILVLYLTTTSQFGSLQQSLWNVPPNKID